MKELWTVFTRDGEVLTFHNRKAFSRYQKMFRSDIKSVVHHGDSLQ